MVCTSGFLKAQKSSISVLGRIMKLNLFTKTFSTVKMHLFELNSSPIEIIFRLQMRDLTKNVWKSVHNSRKTTHYSVLYSDQESLFLFQIIPCVSTQIRCVR